MTYEPTYGMRYRREYQHTYLDQFDRFTYHAIFVIFKGYISKSNLQEKTYISKEPPGLGDIGSRPFGRARKEGA